MYRFGHTVPRFKADNLLGDGSRRSTFTDPAEGETRPQDQTLASHTDKNSTEATLSAKETGLRPHLSSIRFEKSFRSDVTGDGAWRKQNLAWIQSFRFDQEEHTLYLRVTIFEGRTGIRILLADIDRFLRRKISISSIAIQHLIQHTYMQQDHWHAVLQNIHRKTSKMSTPEYIRKILFPALECSSRPCNLDSTPDHIASGSGLATVECNLLSSPPTGPPD